MPWVCWRNMGCVKGPPQHAEGTGLHLNERGESPGARSTAAERTSAAVHICRTVRDFTLLHTPPSSQACKYIEEHMATSTESLGPTTLLNSARTSMSSKIVGAEGDFFAKMVVDAMNAVK